MDEKTFANETPSSEREGESKQLIELLEFELNRIQTQQSKPGWTTWALLASLASLVWLFTIEIEKNQYSWTTSLYVFLVGWIGYSLGMELQPVFFPKESVRLDLLSQSYSKVLLVGLYETILWLFAGYVYLQFHTLTRSLLSFFVFIYIGTTILFLLVAYLGVPLMWKMELPLTTIKTPQSCSDYTLPIIRFIIGSFALFGLLESLWLRLVTPYPTDYRMGLIILGLLILIRFLISVPVESPLVENLVRIRRNLGLGKINVESARNEAEIALLGLSVSAALQKPLTQLLDMIEEQRVIFQSIVAEWQEVHKLWRQSQSNEIQLSEANILIEALGKSIEAHIAEHQQLKNKYHQRLHRFKVRTAILEGMSKDSTSEIDHLFSKIELGEKKIKDEMEEFKAQREREKDKFEEDRKKLSREVDAQKQS